MGADQNESDVSSGAVPNPTTTGVVRRQTWAIMLAAGGIVGLAGWGAIEQFSHTFELPRKLADMSPPYSDEVGQRIEKALRGVALKNRMLSVGLFGALGGALFGTAAGILARSRTSVWVGLAGGVAVGGIFGAAAGALGLLAGEAFNAQNTISHAAASRDAESMWALYGGMVAHATTWMLIGAACAIGVAVAARRNRRVFAIVLAASGAAALWGAIYPFLAAVLFPMSSPEQALPSGIALGLLWALGGSLLIAVAVSRTLQESDSSISRQ